MPIGEDVVFITSLILHRLALVRFREIIVASLTAGGKTTCDQISNLARSASSGAAYDVEDVDN